LPYGCAWDGYDGRVTDNQVNVFQHVPVIYSVGFEPDARVRAAEVRAGLKSRDGLTESLRDCCNLYGTGLVAIRVGG
jgi:hypothetical protein